MELQGLQRSLWVPGPVVPLRPHVFSYFYCSTFTGHRLFPKCVTQFILQTVLWSREWSPFYRSGNHSAQNGNFPMTTQPLSCAIVPKKSDSTLCALNHYLPLSYPDRLWTWVSLWSPAAKWGSCTGRGSLGGVYKTWARKDKLPKEMIWDSTLPITRTRVFYLCKPTWPLQKSSNMGIVHVDGSGNWTFVRRDGLARTTQLCIWRSQDYVSRSLISGLLACY